MIRARSDEAGVILIALLWVLIALSVIALSFSRESLVEVAAARNSRDLADAYYVARAGISATVYRLIERRVNPPLSALELQGQPPDPIEIGLFEGTFGGGAFRVAIQDESGKVNLNFVNDDQLRSLTEILGIPKPDSDIIADSIMDWRDADRAHRINGAEDDYYQAQQPPYKAKNGRLDTVEELLLVRGVTKEYYYGYREKTQDGSAGYRFGLSRYVTVYTGTNRVNVNYAELPVLLSIPAMAPHAAELIYNRRKARPFHNVGEITSELAVTLEAASLPYLSTDLAGVYALTASARMENSKVWRTIRAVVTIDPRDPNQHRILYWNENAANL
jgi:general secretion pathway protein K